MSRVYVLAADKKVPGLEELSYYRQAVEELGYPMKPLRYGLSLDEGERDLRKTSLRGKAWSFGASG